MKGSEGTGYVKADKDCLEENGQGMDRQDMKRSDTADGKERAEIGREETAADCIEAERPICFERQ